MAVAAAGGATAAHVRPAASAAPAAAMRAPRRAEGRAGGAGATAPGPATPGSTAPGRTAHDPADPVEPLPAGGTGAEDFRAVAPPIMSFAQGRRR